MILQEVFHFLDIALKEMGKTYKDIKICELGDQRMKWHPDLVAKKFFINQGVQEHISIDMNGKNGALKLDLSKPVFNSSPSDKWFEHFDLTTNFGTAEHVENGIYQCYQNIHNFTKVGGVMINDGPPAGGCPWHSPYHYEPFFFSKLAELCKYKLIYHDTLVVKGRWRNQAPIDRSLVCSIFVKTPESKYLTEEEFMGIKGITGLNKELL